jgi:hypothetical protein
MKIKTSSIISESDRAANEERLRQAAADAKHPKFFGSNESLEFDVVPSAKSIEELATEAAEAAFPAGDPTLCMIAYQAALRLCNGNEVCRAIAYAAYLRCLG